MVAYVGGRRPRGYTQDRRVALQHIAVGFPAAERLLKGLRLCAVRRVVHAELVIAPVQRGGAV